MRENYNEAYLNLKASSIQFTLNVFYQVQFFKIVTFRVIQFIIIYMRPFGVRKITQLKL